MSVLDVILGIVDHLGVPALVGVGWLLRSNLELRQRVFGLDGTNGLSRNVEKLAEWQQSFDRQYPRDLEVERHKVRNLVHECTAPLEMRIRDLEKRH